MFSAETTGPIFTKVLHVIVAFVMHTRCYPIPFPNGIAIKVIGPEKRLFSTLTRCHGNVPWKIKKAQWGEQALTHVYQSWNFGEDCSISVWATGARKSTIKKWRKNIGKIYSPPGKFAERAKSVNFSPIGRHAERAKQNGFSQYPFWTICLLEIKTCLYV